MKRDDRSDPQAELFAMREQLQRRLMRKFDGSLSWEDCEDITADAIADKAPLAPGGQTSQRVAWFNAVLDHAAIDELRRRGVVQRGDVKDPRPQTVALIVDDDGGDHGAFIEDGGYGVLEDDMDRAYDQADAVRAARRGLRALSRSDRALFYLRVEGLTFPRIADELGLSLKAVDGRWKRARQRFSDAVCGPASDEHCGALRLTHVSAELDRVDPVAVARWEAHLEACVSCRTWVRVLKEATAAIPLVPAGGGLFGGLLGKLGLGGVAERVHAVSDQVATAVGVGGGGGAGAGVLGAIGGKAAATCITAAVCVGGAAYVAVPVVERAVAPPKAKHGETVARGHAKAAGASGAQRPASTTISSAPASVAPASQAARKATRTRVSVQTTSTGRHPRRAARVARETAQAKKARAIGSPFTPEANDPAAVAASTSTSTSSAAAPPATPPPAPADSSHFSRQFSP